MENLQVINLGLISYNSYKECGGVLTWHGKQAEAIINWND